MSDSSPMMQQYERIKASHQDAILFFRMGDFYEMFRSDAVEASRLLSLTLTQRGGVPMCGLPYHACQNYIQRLLGLGKKIAICEQVSQPGKGKGIVEREVVQVLSPGTIIDDTYLGSAEPNWLVSFSKPSPDTFGIASLDMSTGELAVRLVPSAEARQALLQELAGRLPRELLIQESLYREDQGLSLSLASRPDLLINRYPDWHYDVGDCQRRLCGILGVQTLQAFGLADNDPHLHALSALVLYAQDAARRSLDHVKSIRVIKPGSAMVLDETSIRNLELLRNLRDGGKSLSLLWVLDQTQTPMGSRLLRQWLLEPCSNRAEIETRLDAVECLYHNQDVLASLRRYLSKMHDIERLCTRISLERAGPKDCASLGRSLEALLETTELLATLPSIAWQEPGALSAAGEVASLIRSRLVEDPPYQINDGGAFREGVDRRLDELRRLAIDSQEVLDRYLDNERETHGLPGLKLRQNRILGYYLELSRTQSEKVPAHFMRKHSTIQAERFTTQRLLELEDAISHAGEEARQLELALFEDLRTHIGQSVPAMLQLARQTAERDVWAAFAWQATVRGYVRPTIREAPVLYIRGGRHPVVEACVDPGTFVPNDTRLAATLESDPSLMLLTGPNMAGKSTFLRQTALITLMAHLGSFVPAEEAEIGLTDRIFCRVGASDNLAGGESTFLVEMHETAAILRGASQQSLIIMDEVGRGTSTRDGLSIAQAVLEYILAKIGCRALFATHFHELTRLGLSGMQNFSLAVHEDSRGVHFLRKVRQGPSDHSYGVHVAALAGVPREVCERAEVLLEALQGQLTQEQVPLGQNAKGPVAHELVSQGAKPSPKTPNLDLFSPSDQLEQLVRNLDIDRLTPLEALTTLARWKQEFR